jgi:AbrB family looped-hinge helix DNA binding protein
MAIAEGLGARISWHHAAISASHPRMADASGVISITAIYTPLCRFGINAMNTLLGHVSKSGRISLPAQFRKALGIENGGAVIVELNDGEIRIRTIDEVIARAQALSRRLLRNNPKASVDDFIAWRRHDSRDE